MCHFLTHKTLNMSLSSGKERETHIVHENSANTQSTVIFNDSTFFSFLSPFFLLLQWGYWRAVCRQDGGPLQRGTAPSKNPSVLRANKLRIIVKPALGPLSASRHNKEKLIWARAEGGFNGSWKPPFQENWSVCHFFCCCCLCHSVVHSELCKC